MAWPSDFSDGTTLTSALLNAVLAAIKTWGGTVSTGGFALVLPSAAPTDSDIPSGGCVFWLDESGNKLMFRIRYSDGTTLKSGSINLT